MQNVILMNNYHFRNDINVTKIKIDSYTYYLFEIQYEKVIVICY